MKFDVNMQPHSLYWDLKHLNAWVQQESQPYATIHFEFVLSFVLFVVLYFKTGPILNMLILLCIWTVVSVQKIAYTIDALFLSKSTLNETPTDEYFEIQINASEKTLFYSPNIIF